MWSAHQTPCLCSQSVSFHLQATAVAVLPANPMDDSVQCDVLRPACNISWSNSRPLLQRPYQNLWREYRTDMDDMSLAVAKGLRSHSFPGPETDSNRRFFQWLCLTGCRERRPLAGVLLEVRVLPAYITLCGKHLHFSDGFLAALLPCIKNSVEQLCSQKDCCIFHVYIVHGQLEFLLFHRISLWQWQFPWIARRCKKRVGAKVPYEPELWVELTSVQKSDFRLISPHWCWRK